MMKCSYKLQYYIIKNIMRNTSEIQQSSVIDHLIQSSDLLTEMMKKMDGRMSVIEKGLFNISDSGGKERSPVFIGSLPNHAGKGFLQGTSDCLVRPHGKRGFRAHFQSIC